MEDETIDYCECCGDLSLTMIVADEVICYGCIEKLGVENE